MVGDDHGDRRRGTPRPGTARRARRRGCRPHDAARVALGEVELDLDRIERDQVEELLPGLHELAFARRSGARSGPRRAPHARVARARARHAELRLGRRAPRARELSCVSACRASRRRRDALLRAASRRARGRARLLARARAPRPARARAVELELAALGIDLDHNDVLPAAPPSSDQDSVTRPPTSAATALASCARSSPVASMRSSMRRRRRRDHHGRHLRRASRRRASRSRRARARSANRPRVRSITTAFRALGVRGARRRERRRAASRRATSRTSGAQACSGRWSAAGRSAVHGAHRHLEAASVSRAASRPAAASFASGPSISSARFDRRRGGTAELRLARP